MFHGPIKFLKIPVSMRCEHRPPVGNANAHIYIQLYLYESLHINTAGVTFPPKHSS